MNRTLLTCTLLTLPAVPGCNFGMTYTGDETGLLRESYVVPGFGGEREISYLSAGDPDDLRVIYIHGSPGLCTVFVDYLQNPIDGVESIAPDRLGYGQSKPNDRAVLSLEEQAMALEPLLVERDGKWPVVVGYSLGGPIAARLASDYPDRVGGLVLVGSGKNPELEELRWYNKAANRWIVRMVMAQHLNISNDEMNAGKEQITLLSKRLGLVTCPILIIHGTSDQLVPYETVEFSIRSFQDNPNVFVLSLVGSEHAVPRTRPEEFREAVGAMRNFVLGKIVLDQVDETRR